MLPSSTSHPPSGQCFQWLRIALVVQRTTVPNTPEALQIGMSRTPHMHLAFDCWKTALVPSCWGLSPPRGTPSPTWIGRPGAAGWCPAHRWMSHSFFGAAAFWSPRYRCFGGCQCCCGSGADCSPGWSLHHCHRHYHWSSVLHSPGCPGTAGQRPGMAMEAHCQVVPGLGPSSVFCEPLPPDSRPCWTLPSCRLLTQLEGKVSSPTAPQTTG